MQAKLANPAVTLDSVDSAKTALRVFFRMTQEWGLSSAQEETLLGVSRTMLYDWKAGVVRAALDKHVLERMSYIFGIYGALEILIPIPERARLWVKAPNTAPLFAGSSALDRMLGGQVGDLKVVADYLNAQRGGDFA